MKNSVVEITKVWRELVNKELILLSVNKQTEILETMLNANTVKVVENPQDLSNDFEIVKDERDNLKQIMGDLKNQITLLKNENETTLRFKEKFYNENCKLRAENENLQTELLNAGQDFAQLTGDLNEIINKLIEQTNQGKTETFINALITDLVNIKEKARK